MLYLLQPFLPNAQLTKLQMEKEDVFQFQLNLQSHAELDIWVMDKENAFLYQHQFQISQPILQVPVLVKEQ